MGSRKVIRIPRRPYIHRTVPATDDEMAYAGDGRTSFHEFECVRKGKLATDECECFDGYIVDTHNGLLKRVPDDTSNSAGAASPPPARDGQDRATSSTADSTGPKAELGTEAENAQTAAEGRSGYNSRESPQRRVPIVSLMDMRSPLIALFNDEQKWEQIRSGHAQQTYRRTPQGYAWMYARICQIKDMLHADPDLSSGTRILLIYELASLEPIYLVATPMDKDYFRPYEREGPPKRGGVREVIDPDGARGWPLEVKRDTQSMSTWSGITQFWMDRYWREYGSGQVPQLFSYFAVNYNGGIPRGIFQKSAFAYQWKHPTPVNDEVMGQ